MELLVPLKLLELLAPLALLEKQGGQGGQGGQEYGAGDLAPLEIGGRHDRL